MKIQKIEKTIGNYLNFPDMKFPLDAEGLRDVQTNEALLAVLGNIGGERYYIAQPTSQTQWCGFAFVPTEENPCGELLYIDGAGDSGAGMQTHLCLVEEEIDITAGSVPYVAAYCKRKLVHGTNRGIEQFAKSGFKQIETNSALKQRLDSLAATVNNQYTVPKGAIIMWSGTTPPTGWALCDGTRGTPDLRGRYVMGATNDDAEYKLGYNTPPKRKVVKLNANHIPAHTHPAADGSPFVHSNNGVSVKSGGENTRGLDENSRRYCPETGKNATTNSAFDIRGSYYALAFIMKL